MLRNRIGLVCLAILSVAILYAGCTPPVVIHDYLTTTHKAAAILVQPKLGYSYYASSESEPGVIYAAGVETYDLLDNSSLGDVDVRILILTKFDATGAVAWTRRYPDPDGEGSDWFAEAQERYVNGTMDTYSLNSSPYILPAKALAVAENADGNIALTGQIAAIEGYDGASSLSKPRNTTSIIFDPEGSVLASQQWSTEPDEFYTSSFNSMMSGGRFLIIDSDNTALYDKDFGLLWSRAGAGDMPWQTDAIDGLLREADYALAENIIIGGGGSQGGSGPSPIGYKATRRNLVSNATIWEWQWSLSQGLDPGSLYVRGASITANSVFMTSVAKTFVIDMDGVAVERDTDDILGPQWRGGILVADPSGNDSAYLRYVRGSEDHRVYELLKLGADGETIWQRQFQVQADYYANSPVGASKMAFDDADNPILVMQTFQSGSLSGACRYHVYRLNQDGEITDYYSVDGTRLPLADELLYTDVPTLIANQVPYYTDDYQQVLRLTP